MNRREKRDLGLLPSQIMVRTRVLCYGGEITKEMSRKEAAVVVAFSLANSDEATHDEWEKIEYGSVDWDAVLAFIEKLLAILLPLFLKPDPA